MKRTREYSSSYPKSKKQRIDKYRPTYSYTPPQIRTLPRRPNPVEKKAIDTQMYADITNTGSFYALCVPVPGAGLNQRIGRRITIRSVQMKGIVQMELASSPAGGVTAEANHLRMILLYDRQPNAALPNVTDVLTGGQTVNDLFNLDNRDRFQILKDKVWSFDPMVYDSTNHGFAWSKTATYLKLFKKLNLETTFNAGTAGTSADVTSGNLIVLWLTNTPSGTDKNVDIYVNARVRYVDQ